MWWDYASEHITKESFANVATAIEKYVLPWFEQVSTEEGYRAELLNLHNKKLAKEWTDAMENIEDKERLISTHSTCFQTQWAEKQIEFLKNFCP